MRFVILIVCATLLSACRRDMAMQPKLRPQGPSEFFANGMASRPLPPHTIARGELRDDELRFTGRLAGQLATTFPAPVTRATLERGQQRYDIFCAVCHGATGAGDGMIVQRGFPPPPTFHQDRLRAAPPGYFFEVITRGYGLMYPYASRVPPGDRWAIIAYLRALQLSEHATLADATAEARTTLESIPR